MFNYQAFTPNQVSSPVRVPQNRPLQNLSPAYFPNAQPNQARWEGPTSLPQSQPELPAKEEMPYNVRVLLEDEQGMSSTSSDSEETDTMPEVSPKFRTSLVKEWDFGQEEVGRRKSEILTSGSPLLQNGNLRLIPGPPAKSWTPFLPGKVNVKPTFFGPLNLSGFAQTDNRAYFVTLEGFNSVNLKRIFKVERLCHGLQARNINDAKNGKQFLYMGLWNDWHNGQGDMDNIFEPWIYAVPNLQFRIVVKIHMSHAYEEPYIFDFLVDLRQFGLPSQERRTQSLEVSYSESGSNDMASISTNAGNNITLHLQITNEKLLVPHGFRNVHDSHQEGKDGSPLNYTVILRQLLVRLPLCRTGNLHSPISPLLTQNPHRLHDVYGKRGSAINLGQEHRSPIVETEPHSPLSWSNFSPEKSPTPKHVTPKRNSQGDPILPPGIMKNGNGQPDNSSFQSSGSGSMFKFKGQHRFSIQQIREPPRETEEFGKRTNRILSSDFSSFLEGDKSPLKVLEAYVKAVKSGQRKESTTSDGSTVSAFSMVSRFQIPASACMTENDQQNQSASTLNASGYAESVPDVVGVEEDPNAKASDVTEEFRVEDYVGRMVEFARTYQGSKVLQKYVATADQEDLDLVVREIGEKIGELMLDPYANYMIQTLVQNGFPRQRLYLLQKIAPSFVSIARDKKGTHSLQAIVGQIDSPDEFAVIRNIIGNSIFELSMDSRANYVIQKLINTIPVDSSQFLYQPLFDNFVQLANNSFGLLVLKQMMARVEQRDALKQRIVELTCVNFEKLIQNPYGNYAIQHIIEFHPKESLTIMNKILAKIIPYSSQKISSNVIEKCLAVCDSSFRRRVVDEILKNGRLGDLMKNKYGNFVTLQLLATAGSADKQRLMQEIFKAANSFNGTKYKLRWLKFTQDNPMKIVWNGGQEGAVMGEPEQDSNDDEPIKAEKLESVKQIWREMTKEEKNESPFHYNKAPPSGKKQYNSNNSSKRDDFYNASGWNDKI